MDKRFEKIIKMMDEQSNKAVELQKHVSKMFDSVKKTQGVIEGKTKPKENPL